MGADEEGTHKRLKAHLREVIEPKIRERHGRIVKTTGDGVLAEFASVVDAVRCAGEIQRAMADRDLDLAEERRLRFRIGINLGDVIADGDDIYGDGVNIAARLEGLAPPGGICISGTVRDHLGDRLPYALENGRPECQEHRSPGASLRVATHGRGFAFDHWFCGRGRSGAAGPSSARLS
jgi:adenylate cyclase